MEIFLQYLQVFAVGGLVCLLGQLLINLTNITSSKILVSFLLLGLLLEAVGVFDYIKEFGGAGITVPITGFGANLAKGAIEGSKKGLLFAFTEGVVSATAGLSAAIFFGFLFALIFRSKTKV